MTYGHVHRFLLRSLASRGVMSLQEIETILNKFAGGETLEESVQDYIKEINEVITPFQQSIKIAVDEYTGDKVIIFLSHGYDNATKAQGVFSATQLEFFRVLLEQIMTTESRQITGIHALNLVGNMKSTFSKTDAQKLLNIWCQMKYLDKDESNYALGVRAIHEFDGYIQQNMPDTIENCVLCTQIVFRGYNCPACVKAIHTRCLNKYLEKVQKWPCCKADFRQSQLDKINSESSRLTQGQLETQTPCEQPDIELEPTQVLEQTEDVEMTQEIIPEISQRVTRKRKRE